MKVSVLRSVSVEGAEGGAGVGVGIGDSVGVEVVLSEIELKEVKLEGSGVPGVNVPTAVPLRLGKWVLEAEMSEAEGLEPALLGLVEMIPDAEETGVETEGSETEAEGFGAAKKESGTGIDEPEPMLLGLGRTAFGAVALEAEAPIERSSEVTGREGVGSPSAEDAARARTERTMARSIAGHRLFTQNQLVRSRLRERGG